MTNLAEQTIQTLEVTKSEEIAAPIDIVFESILEQMGELNQGPDGVAMPMKIEPWPGGRWFRDLGNNSGHCWGTVQSIKAPTLLEIQGPLFMSAPVISHVQYRLSSDRGATRVTLSHRAIGLIAPEFLDGVKINMGWSNLINRIRQAAEQRSRMAK